VSIGVNSIGLNSIGVVADEATPAITPIVDLPQRYLWEEEPVRKHKHEESPRLKKKKKKKLELQQELVIVNNDINKLELLQDHTPVVNIDESIKIRQELLAKQAKRRKLLLTILLLAA
jgi:hypothetical protein